ncbi:hypothetical protein [Halocola ammonii]
MATSFKKNLIAFFKEHDPNAITVVPKIVKSFSHRQKEVYDYLSDRYGVEIDYDIDEPKVIDNTGGPVPEADQGAEPV